MQDDYYKRVRSIQRELRKLRRSIFLRTTSKEYAVREAAQHANDCTFCNPGPGSDDAAKRRWAQRWMAKYESRLAALMGNV